MVFVCWCRCGAAALAVGLQQVCVPAVKRFAERLGGTLPGLDCVSLHQNMGCSMLSASMTEAPLRAGR